MSNDVTRGQITSPHFEPYTLDLTIEVPDVISDETVSFDLEAHDALSLLVYSGETLWGTIPLNEANFSTSGDVSTMAKIKTQGDGTLTVAGDPDDYTYVFSVARSGTATFTCTGSKGTAYDSSSELPALADVDYIYASGTWTAV